MQGLMLFENGFEMVEALATVDILKRAGIDVKLISLNNNIVTSSSNVNIIVDNTIEEVDYHSFDFLIIPGGPSVLNSLINSDVVENIINYYVKASKVIGTICAAPILIGKLGYFDNENYTCYGDLDKYVISGNKVKEPVVISNNFVTARSMYYSVDFGLALVEKLLGKDMKEKIERQVKSI